MFDYTSIPFKRNTCLFIVRSLWLMFLFFLYLLSLYLLFQILVQIYLFNTLLLFFTCTNFHHMSWIDSEL